MNNIFYLKAAALVMVGAVVDQAGAAGLTFQAVGKQHFDSQAIPIRGTFVKGLTIRDMAGEHALLLTRLTGPSSVQPGTRNEQTQLRVAYFTRVGNAWKQDWTINDGVDCPGLDHAAQFFSSQVTVTDLDGNGMAEVTVPYKLFCGGGIDAAVLKIIMRQGDQKFAMRGTTLIAIPGETPFGGEATYDKSLSLPVNVPFRKHIAAVRAAVVTEKY